MLGGTKVQGVGCRCTVTGTVERNIRVWRETLDMIRITNTFFKPAQCDRKEIRNDDDRVGCAYRIVMHIGLSPCSELSTEKRFPLRCDFGIIRVICISGFSSELVLWAL